MLSIDLNCDMGESTHLWEYSIEKDLALLDAVSSVNLACGFHAGDEQTLHELVEAALEKGIAIGAHPSFPDRENFGRVTLSLSPQRIYDLILYQIGAVEAFLKIHGSHLHHVKPHGALYNLAAIDSITANSIVNAIYDYNPALLVYGLSNSQLIQVANEKGLAVKNEVFADRTYQADGTLTPRSQSNALITDETMALQQVMRMIQKSEVVSTHGTVVPIKAETLCIHGDGAKALDFARSIHQMLLQNQIAIQP